jgi:hypothetical protein
MQETLILRRYFTQSPSLNRTAVIANHYEDGDRIFLFGFSRGAYTVRSLANLLILCGVPTNTPSGPLMMLSHPLIL